MFIRYFVYMYAPDANLIICMANNYQMVIRKNTPSAQSNKNMNHGKMCSCMMHGHVCGAHLRVFCCAATSPLRGSIVSEPKLFFTCSLSFLSTELSNLLLLGVGQLAFGRIPQLLALSMIYLGIQQRPG